MKVIRPLRKTGKLIERIVSLQETNRKFPRASLIASQHLPVRAMDEAESGLDERVEGYVYMLRYGKKYKIGKSGDPARRYAEVSLLLPEETYQVHTIPTDDPAGIEAYWHFCFGARRIGKAEFFTLDGKDVQAFKRRKYQ